MLKHFLKYAIVAFFLCLFGGCDFKPTTEFTKNQSFYYWKTIFKLTDTERKTLQNNAIDKLYIRFFDVGLVGNKVEPLGKIFFNEKPVQNVVPVVFIKNEIFYDKDLDIKNLASKTHQLIAKIASYNEILFDEIQIDCDWSLQTKAAYFLFLEELKKCHKKTVSVTIRLHQIKYAEQTGIPEVDSGVLMYYNMGKINADDKNSIYDREIALKYIPSIKNYNLPLVTALPIFNWLVHLRNEQVVQVIPKTDPNLIENLSEIKTGIFEVNSDTYFQNYTLKKGDQLKLESVPYTEIQTIVNDINRYSELATQQIIWYDLDEHNINWYKNETLFK
nr:hypothetical protein [uncultured Flavobacterium sp.]